MGNLVINDCPEITGLYFSKTKEDILFATESTSNSLLKILVGSNAWFYIANYYQYIIKKSESLDNLKSMVLEPSILLHDGQNFPKICPDPFFCLRAEPPLYLDSSFSLLAGIFSLLVHKWLIERIELINREVDLMLETFLLLSEAATDNLGLIACNDSTDARDDGHVISRILILLLNLDIK